MSEAEIMTEAFFPFCDWCHDLATHITHHERKNTGTLVAYWCDRHFEQNRRQQTPSNP